MNDNFNALAITDEMRMNFLNIINLVVWDSDWECLEKTPLCTAEAIKFLTERYEKDQKKLCKALFWGKLQRDGYR